MAQCFAAYGAYGAAEKIALMDVHELAPLNAAQVFRANLRAIGHKGSFFREQFVDGFVLGSGIAGKACMQGCPHSFGAVAGEFHVWTHMTSSDPTKRSKHEEHFASHGGAPPQQMTSFFFRKSTLTPTAKPPAPPTHCPLTMTTMAETTMARTTTSAAASTALAYLEPGTHGVGNHGGTLTTASAAASTALVVHGGRVFPCKGFLPRELSCFLTQYPWGLHNMQDVPWEARTNDGGALFSTEPPCTPVEDQGSTCGSCIRLRYLTELTKVIAKAANSPAAAASHDNDAYCSLAAMGLRRDSQRTAKNANWLTAQNALRKVRIRPCGCTVPCTYSRSICHPWSISQVQRLSRAVSLQRRLTHLLQTNDVPKLRQILSTALRHGCSVSRLLDRLTDAINGAYRVKGDYTDKDYDLATLIMRLGGGKLLFALAKAVGLPSESDWYRHKLCKIPKILPSPGMRYLEEAVLFNLKEVYGDPSGVSGGGPVARYLFSLLIDEIAIDTSVTHDNHFNCAIGCCYEHSGRVDLTLSDEDGMRRLKGAIDAGHLHANCDGQRQAKEALVLSIAPFANANYFAKPVVIMATCKEGDRTMQRIIIETVERVWDEHGYADKFGPISSAYSDGDAPRRQAFVDTETELLDSTTALGRLLGDLELFDLHVAPKQRTRAFDIKHILKRIRAVFKSNTRGTVAGAKGGSKVGRFVFCFT
jgi:hypothetical protein